MQHANHESHMNGFLYEANDGVNAFWSDDRHPCRVRASDTHGATRAAFHNDVGIRLQYASLTYEII